MFKNIEPLKIYSITSKAPKYVFFIFILILSIGLVEALILSPEAHPGLVGGGTGYWGPRGSGGAAAEEPSGAKSGSNERCWSPSNRI